MSWKKTFPYYFIQSLRFASNWRQFRYSLTTYTRWKTFQAPGRAPMADQLPWLNFPALDFLERFIRPDFRVFEYGGGGSSLFFCKRVAEVVTVESSPVWFAELKQKISEYGYQNWNGILQEAEPSAENIVRDPANPAHFGSSAPGFEHYSFEKYARAIDTYPDDYFDLILVDGRARPSCIRQALPHLRKNGALIVDNTERTYYLAAFKASSMRDFSVETDEIAPIPYSEDFVRSSVFRKK